MPARRRVVLVVAGALVAFGIAGVVDQLYRQAQSDAEVEIEVAPVGLAPPGASPAAAQGQLDLTAADLCAGSDELPGADSTPRTDPAGCVHQTVEVAVQVAVEPEGVDDAAPPVSLGSEPGAGPPGRSTAPSVDVLSVAGRDAAFTWALGEGRLSVDAGSSTLVVQVRSIALDRREALELAERFASEVAATSRRG